MRKIFITLLLTLFFCSTKAQNLIGFSYEDAWLNLNQKEYIVSNNYTDDNILFISATDNESVRFYYFSKDDICVIYALSYPNLNLIQIKRGLLDAGYRPFGNEFYKDEFKANIVYLDEYSCYFVIVSWVR